MAIQPVNLFAWPQCFDFQPVLSGASSSIANTISASGAKVAFLFRAPKTGTINQVGFATGTVTKNTNPLKVSFQTVDLTTGNPSGTVDQFRNITVTATTDNNTWKETGLVTSDGTDTGVKRSVNRGDLICMVIEFSSFTASDSVVINGFQASGGKYYFGNGYVNVNNGTSWTKQTNQVPQMAVQYSDGNYYHIKNAVPHYNANINATASGTFGSGSSPNEKGMVFTMPFKCTVSGLWVNAVFGNEDGIVTLYDTDGSTSLGSVQVDKDVRPTGTTFNNTYAVLFANDVTLNAGSTYRIGVKSASTLTISLTNFQAFDNAHMAGYESGINVYFTSRTGTGAWANITNTLPIMGLLVSGLDDGAGKSAAPLIGHVR